ncbi:MAG: methyl-accepting chemotaxis protein [Isosphaeraceae bacterium]|nr:methyl-accepting chemotaxis protein [Isosphaeraceae bacterium]
MTNDTGHPMSRLRSSFRGASITTRLLFWFIAISFVPSVLLTGLTGYLSRHSLEQSVRDRLMLVTESKTALLENFVRERRGDAAILGSAPGIIEAAVQLDGLLKKTPAGAPEYLRASEPYRANLLRYSDIYGYRNIHLLSMDGVFLVSIKPEFEMGSNLLSGPLKDTEMANVFLRSRALLQSALSDYQIYAGRNEPAAYLAGPVFSNGVAVGLVLLEFGNDQVFSVFNDTSGLGDTGETLVAMRQGDELVYVAPSRFEPDLAFKKKIRFGEKVAVAMQRGVQGERGYGVTNDYRGETVVATWSYLPSFRWGLVVKQDSDEAFELIYHQRLAMAALMAAMGLLVTAVALAVARGVSRPIREAALVANAVASGDLSRHVTTTAPGEAGVLLDAVRTMTRDLRTLIGKIQRSSVTLMSTATEIAATSKQQEQTVMDYGASTNEAAAAVKEISATSQELLRTMNEVNDVAGSTARMASAGQDDLSGMDRTMRLLADSTGSISSKLSVISERAANINLVVTTITKVADQTNLLSINAAIEAEKAGEYGLGFLVVAREIRRLADQTAVATLDIERMVKEMQSSVAAGVMEMDKFSEQVRQGVSDVESIGGQLGEIITAVQGLTERFEHVTEGMRVQSQGADQIREAVMRINEGANQTSVSLREFNKATSHLREAVSLLKEEVSRFTLGDGPVDEAGT